MAKYQYIQVGDEVVEFPADMSDEEIAAALSGDAPEPTVKEVIEATPAPLRALANLPGSAQNLYQQAVLNPLQDPLAALQGVGQLALGTVQKAGDVAEEYLGPVAGFSPINWALDKAGVDYRAAPESVAEHFGDRYGSLEAAGETFRDDPAGALADLSVVTPIGARARTATADKLRGGAESLMERTVKPSTVLPREQRRGMMRTMLDEGVNPSARGLDTLEALIEERAGVVNELLAAAEATGGTVPLGEVLRPLRDLRRRRGSSLAGGGDAAAAIDQFIRDRVTDARRQGKTQLSAQDLQQLKRDLYDQINWNARRQVDEVPVLEEARKETARSARRQIEGMAPQVAEENRRLGNLLELRPTLERAVNRIENRDMIGMSDFLGGGAGLGVGAATGNPILGSAIFGVSELLNNPRLAPYTARAMDRLGRATTSRRIDQFLRENPDASTAAIAAYLESLAEEPVGVLMEN